MDTIPFHLEGEGDFVVISFNSVVEALALLKKYRVSAAKNNKQVVLMKKTLTQIDLTICYNNRRLAFMGPKANPLASKIFTLVTSSKN